MEHVIKGRKYTIYVGKNENLTLPEANIAPETRPPQ